LVKDLELIVIIDFEHLRDDFHAHGVGLAQVIINFDFHGDGF
ncbi:MAG: hypothetical protein ACI91F_003046, partial [Candidatus Binatia bacterium]